MPFHSATFEAIGVVNQITLTDPGALSSAMEIARAEVAALDLACSRFREDSEIVALNACGPEGMIVSPLLSAATALALDAARATGGLVDPTIGQAMRGLGYDRDFDLLLTNTPKRAFKLIPAAGWESVKLDHASRRITMGRAAELDLGATAKAFCADRIAREVRSLLGAEVLVSLGGDIAVAGSPPAGWPILLGDDHRRNGAGQVVAIHDGALATSSTTVRRWQAGHLQVHHIVNPSTGAPASEHWRTVSVTADSCVDANAAATAAIVLGTRAVAWLERHGLAARLVHRDGSVTRVGGWPEGGDQQQPRSTRHREADASPAHA